MSNGGAQFQLFQFADDTGTPYAITAELPNTPANIYVSAIGDDAHDGLSTSTPKKTIGAALALIPNPSSTSCTIHVASGAYSLNEIQDAAIYVDKKFINSTSLTINGYINSTPNSFAHSPYDSGTSSGSNTNNFPINDTPTADETYFYDTSKSGVWTTNSNQFKWLKLTGGTGYVSGSFNLVDNWYFISSSTTTRLNIVGRWASTTPDVTTTYEIYDPANAPIFTVGAADYGLKMAGAEKVSINFLKLLEPTVGSFQISDAKTCYINMAHLTGGDSGIYQGADVRVYKSYLEGTSDRLQGVEVLRNSVATFRGSLFTGYAGRGLYALRAEAYLQQCYLDSTNTHVDSGVNAGVYADAGSAVGISGSRIYGRNFTSGANYAVFESYHAQVQIQPYVHLIGFSNTANTYGLGQINNANVEVNTGPALISNVWRGRSSVGQSIYFTSGADFTYASIGAGGNVYEDLAQSNVTSSRLKNTTYTNTSYRPLLVHCTWSCAITTGGGSVFIIPKSDSASPPTTQVAGAVGINAGLLNDSVLVQQVFIVAAGMNYRIDTTETNGTATLGKWFEIGL